MITIRHAAIRQESEDLARLHALMLAIGELQGATVSRSGAAAELRARAEVAVAVARCDDRLLARTLSPQNVLAIRQIAAGAPTFSATAAAAADRELRDVMRRRSAGLLRRSVRFSEQLELVSWYVGGGMLIAMTAIAIAGSIQRRQIADRDFARSALTAANEELRASMQQLRERSKAIEALGRMGELLQISASLEELRSVVDVFGKLLFPSCGGAVYSIRESRDSADLVASWSAAGAPVSLLPADCWGLRRGTIHVSGRADGIRCSHSGPDGATTICIPMAGQGETTGVLSIILPDGVSANEQHRHLSKAMADQLSLTLANLRLKESLRALAVRDGLTNLYNRRYMEESLAQEFRRARRHAHEIGVLMIDVDHFKHFNDTYGHMGGDLYLQEFSRTLASAFRAEDIVCRYGGEEFAVIVPDPGELDLRQRAEALRKAAADLEVTMRDGRRARTTISVGIAVAPRDGSGPDAVLSAADRALYEAKRAGRNRVATSGIRPVEDLPMDRAQVIA